METVRTQEQLELYDTLLDSSEEERERFLITYENMNPNNAAAVREMFQERAISIQTPQALPCAADIFHQTVLPQKSILKVIAQPIIEVEEQKDIHRLANEKHETFIAKSIAIDQYEQFGSERLSLSDQLLVKQWLDEKDLLKALNRYQEVHKIYPNLPTASLFAMLLPFEQILLRQWVHSQSNGVISIKKASIAEVNEREALLRQEENADEKTTKIRFSDRDQRRLFSIHAPSCLRLTTEEIPTIARSRDNGSENLPNSKKRLQPLS